MNASSKQDQNIDQYRRRFLGQAAVIAGASLSSGLILNTVAHAKPAGTAVDNSKRWGILINTAKCDDCNACVTACSDENGWGGKDNSENDSSAEQQAVWIRKVKLKDKATGHVQSLPLMCQHCENPPCVDVCPTGASMKRADGIVLVDKHICIGCRYCMMACPYKARSFIHESIQGQKVHAPRGKGTVESCTMCVHRVDNDGTPACVEACNAKHGDNKAMFFGDLKNPDNEISKELVANGGEQLRPDLDLNTGVRYQGLK